MELGEIESHLELCPGVDRAIVIVREDIAGLEGVPDYTYVC
jgi:hypothetical protein